MVAWCVLLSLCGQVPAEWEDDNKRPPGLGISHERVMDEKGSFEWTPKPKGEDDFSWEGKCKIKNIHTGQKMDGFIRVWVGHYGTDAGCAIAMVEMSFRRNETTSEVFESFWLDKGDDDSEVGEVSKVQVYKLEWSDYLPDIVCYANFPEIAFFVDPDRPFAFRFDSLRVDLTPEQRKIVGDVADIYLDFEEARSKEGRKKIKALMKKQEESSDLLAVGTRK